LTWSVSFYSEKVKDQTLANFLHITELIEEFGPGIGGPYVAALGGGLFEIRAKGKEGIGRALYCHAGGQELIVLHSFTKKSRRTPLKELKLARKRMKEVKNEPPKPK
jgi:phage-related protein